MHQKSPSHRYTQSPPVQPAATLHSSDTVSPTKAPGETGSTHRHPASVLELDDELLLLDDEDELLEEELDELLELLLEELDDDELELDEDELDEELLDEELDELETIQQQGIPAIHYEQVDPSPPYVPPSKLHIAEVVTKHCKPLDSV